MPNHFKVLIVVEGEDEFGDWQEETIEICTTETFGEAEEIAAAIKHETGKWDKHWPKAAP